MLRKIHPPQMQMKKPQVGAKSPPKALCKYINHIISYKEMKICSYCLLECVVNIINYNLIFVNCNTDCLKSILFLIFS